MRAEQRRASVAVLLGDGELERGVVAVKTMATHTQEDLPRASAARILADRVASTGWRS